jgi:hypothetical protein
MDGGTRGNSGADVPSGADRALRGTPLTMSERQRDNSHLETVGRTSAKFIQICASQNDLFALDEEGTIYQYNFSVKTWIKLVVGHAYDERP